MRTGLVDAFPIIPERTCCGIPAAAAAAAGDCETAPELKLDSKAFYSSFFVCGKGKRLTCCKRSIKFDGCCCFVCLFCFCFKEERERDVCELLFFSRLKKWVMIDIFCAAFDFVVRGRTEQGVAVTNTCS